MCAVLQGSDPSMYEMQQKIDLIQKKLIDKSHELVSMDQRLNERDQEVQALRCVLARRPGPEVSQQLSVSRRNGAEKTKTIRVHSSLSLSLSLSLFPSLCLALFLSLFPSLCRHCAGILCEIFEVFAALKACDVDMTTVF